MTIECSHRRGNPHPGELCPRLAFVLEQRAAGATFVSIGARLGVSAVRARQLYQQGVRTLRRLGRAPAAG